MQLDLDKIKEAIERTDLPRGIREELVLSIIASSKDALPVILKILDFERKEQELLLLETNALLSSSLGVLMSPNLLKKKHAMDSWLVDKIKKHYILWQTRIKCGIKVEGLP